MNATRSVLVVSLLCVVSRLLFGAESPVASSAITRVEITNRWQPASIEDLRQAADRGEATAQFYLGWRYARGIGLQREPKSAATWYRLAADQGLAEAQNELGWMYSDGVGVESSREQAMKWLRAASDQGLAQAQLRLGSLYERDDSLPGDRRVGNYAVAAEWYERAAKQGHLEAMYCLGRLYHEGKLPHDPLMAMKWLQPAAEKGFDQAALLLGHIHATFNRGGTVDYAEAVKWYRQVAERGIPEGQFRLGWMYSTGAGVPKDLKEAERWLRRAADRGHWAAQARLNELLSDQDNRGAIDVPALRQAASRGDPTARLRLANALVNSAGGQTNVAEAVDIYLSVFKEARNRQKSEAAENAVALLASGQWRPPPKEAIHVLSELRHHLSSPEQFFQVGEMLYRGEHLPEDWKSAVDWFQQAAWHGSAPAMNRMGELWAAGVNGEPDPVEAAKWYRRAARLGLGEAQVNLARLLLGGNGLARDITEAYKWFYIAGKHPATGGHQKLVELEKELSPEQIAEAKRRADELISLIIPSKSK